MKGKSDYVIDPLSDQAIWTLLSGLQKAPAPISVLFDTYGRAINEVASDATAFVHRGETKYSIQYYKEWKSAAPHLLTDRARLGTQNLGFGPVVFAPYGVRSALTRRASWIVSLEPAERRQVASKFGQACCEQSRPTLWMSSRSDFASASGTLASTCGAKPGRSVRAAATNAAIKIAATALIMTVPCRWGLGGPTFRWLTFS